MNEDKEVVSAVLSLVNIQYNYFVELLGVFTIMLAQKRLLRRCLYYLQTLTPKRKMERKERNVHRLVSG